MQRIRIYLILFSLLVVADARSQLTGNNFFEFQIGNLPETQPSDLTTHYDQLNLQYRYQALRAEIRYEHFLSQVDDRSYNRLTQYSLQYRKKGLNLQVGNFSEILGNGLLLRAYEIPGSVFEDQAYRVRHGFYRDLRGFSLNYSGNAGYVKVVRGKTLVNALPPTLEEKDRRPDLSEGLEGGLYFKGQTAGLILMRNTNGASHENYYSLLLNGNLLSIFSYNFEFAHNFGENIPLVSLADDTRYGIYGSVNYSLGRFGLSAEYKDYHNLLIGAGISDPPTLVKEQKYKVLNRSIHVPIYFDERGVQVEAYYSFSTGARLLFNYARAVNYISREYVFSEYFAEYYFEIGNVGEFALFADYSQDPLKFEDNRYSSGITWDYRIAASHSTHLQFEYQHVERNLITETVFNNIVLIAGYSHSPKTSVSITWEMSGDPNLTGGASSRSWIGADISQKFNSRNTLSIFAGQRRGGPACTAGVCYEVLDFRGIEVRFNTKF